MGFPILHADLKYFRAIGMPFFFRAVQNIVGVSFDPKQFPGDPVFLCFSFSNPFGKSDDPSLPSIVKIFNCFAMTFSIFPTGYGLRRALFEGFNGLA